VVSGLIYRNISSSAVLINPLPPSPPINNDTGGSTHDVGGNGDDTSDDDDNDDTSPQPTLMITILRALSRHNRVFCRINTLNRIMASLPTNTSSNINRSLLNTLFV